MLLTVAGHVCEAPQCIACKAGEVSADLCRLSGSKLAWLLPQNADYIASLACLHGHYCAF